MWIADSLDRWAACLVVALVAASVLAPPSLAADEPPRFAVLQAAYYAFSQQGPTNQTADERAVLLEQSSTPGGPLEDIQHNATDVLLNATTRGQFVMTEYQNSNSSDPLTPPLASRRLPDYYRAELLPTSIFDGTRRLVAFGPSTPATFIDTYESARAQPAGASIWARGAIVLDNGYLEVEASLDLDLANTRSYLRAVLVEDHLTSPADGRDLRYVVRSFLGNLDTSGGGATGRFNFTLDPTWLESRLGAVLFVQSDGRVEGTPPPAPEPQGDLLRSVLLTAGPALMVGLLGVLIITLSRREQRARR